MLNYRDRFITRSVGVAKVRQGFSIPPYGKLGGRTSISYIPHTYGPHSSSAFNNIVSVSANSYAALSTKNRMKIASFSISASIELRKD